MKHESILKRAFSLKKSFTKEYQNKFIVQVLKFIIFGYTNIKNKTAQPVFSVSIIKKHRFYLGIQ